MIVRSHLVVGQRLWDAEGKVPALYWQAVEANLRAEHPTLGSVTVTLALHTETDDDMIDAHALLTAEGVVDA